MNNRLERLGAMAGALMSILCANCCVAALYSANYQGHGDGSAGGIISNGSMDLSDRGASLYGTINAGSRFFSDAIVIYIDCRAGGFNDNLSFFDYSTTHTRAISGSPNPDFRSRAHFAPGFGADFALVLSQNYGSGLYQLAAGGNGSLGDRIPISFNENWQFSVNWSDLGITDPAAHYFTFSSTAVSGNGYRYLESYENISGQSGYNYDVTWSGYNVFGIAAVPEPVNVALAGFAGVLATGGLVFQLRRFTRRNRLISPQL
jgi:hypothetical protein